METNKIEFELKEIDVNHFFDLSTDNILFKNVDDIALRNRELTDKEYISLKEGIIKNPNFIKDNPIILTHDLQLIDGRHRLKVFKELKFDKIWCKIAKRELTYTEKLDLFNAGEAHRDKSTLDKAILAVEAYKDYQKGLYKVNSNYLDEKGITVKGYIADLYGISIQTFNAALNIDKYDSKLLHKLSYHYNCEYILLKNSKGNIFTKSIQLISTDINFRQSIKDEIDEEDLIGKVECKDDLKQYEYYSLKTKYPKLFKQDIKFEEIVKMDHQKLAQLYYNIINK